MFGLYKHKPSAGKNLKQSSVINIFPIKVYVYINQKLDFEFYFNVAQIEENLILFGVSWFFQVFYNNCIQYRSICIHFTEMNRSANMQEVEVILFQLFFVLNT